MARLSIPHPPSTHGWTIIAQAGNDSPLKHAAAAGYKDLLGAGAAIALGVALPGQGDERRLELLTPPHGVPRAAAGAPPVASQPLVQRELLQERLSEGGLGRFIPPVLLAVRVAELAETRADARLPLIVCLVVKLLV